MAEGTAGKGWWQVRHPTYLVAVTVASCVAFLAACGGKAPATDEASSAPNAGASTAPSAGLDWTSALGVAFNLPRTTLLAAVETQRTLVEAVYAIRQQGGRNPYAGTLTELPGGMQYTPTPADRLVVRKGQLVQEFQVKDAAGNELAPTATQWINAPHRLTYVYRLPGQGEYAIVANFEAAPAFTARVSGSGTLQGAKYDLDLSTRGTITVLDSDITGQHYRTQQTVAGSVKGGGAEIEVHEQYASEFASDYSMSLTCNQRGYSSQLQSTITSTIRSGNDVFQFVNAQLVTFARERCNAVTSGITSLGGQITRGGRPFAVCQVQNGQPIATAGTRIIPLIMGSK